MVDHSEQLLGISPPNSPLLSRRPGAAQSVLIGALRSSYILETAPSESSLACPCESFVENLLGLSRLIKCQSRKACWMSKCPFHQTFRWKHLILWGRAVLRPPSALYLRHCLPAIEETRLRAHLGHRLSQYGRNALVWSTKVSHSKWIMLLLAPTVLPSLRDHVPGVRCLRLGCLNSR